MKAWSSWMPIVGLLAIALTLFCRPAAAQSTPTTVRPGAPGEPTRTIDPDDVNPPESAPHTEADVRFMQGMIPHHAQALVMTDLVPERTDSRGLRLIARRIEISQRDEIAWMQTWLRNRGEDVPPLDAHHAPRHGAEKPAHGEGHHDRHGKHDAAQHGKHDAGHHGKRGKHDATRHGKHDAPQHGAGHAADPHALMPGMLTPDELARLAAATGAEFERLFLQFMISHHEGALVMVKELLASPGAAQHPEVYRFASDVEADQAAEINRMRAMLAARTHDAH